MTEPQRDRPALHRVLPTPSTTTTVLDAYAVERPPHPERPWIGLCMVTSLDGSVTIGGTSGGLGNPNDLEVLLTLRDLADVVIVGAGTVLGEGYGPPRLPGKRIGVVTNSGRVDVDTELFRSGAGFLITAERTDVPDGVDVLRAGRERVDLGIAVTRLHEQVPGVRYAQAEGGPTLNGALLDHDLIDEIDITLSPTLVGGDGPRLAVGADEEHRRFSLAHVLTDTDGYVFTRWVRDAGTR